MEKKMKFKTNAKCAGCVSAIGNKLNEIMKPEDWSIDLKDPDKSLEVKADVDPDKVVLKVKEAGFKAEPLYIF